MNNCKRNKIKMSLNSHSARDSSPQSKYLKKRMNNFSEEYGSEFVEIARTKSRTPLEKIVRKFVKRWFRQGCNWRYSG